MKTMYLCDRKQICKYSPLCGKECKYTTHISHAMNPETSDFVQLGDSLWERNEEVEELAKKV